VPHAVRYVAVRDEQDPRPDGWRYAHGEVDEAVGEDRVPQVTGRRADRQDVVPAATVRNGGGACGRSVGR